MNPLQNKNRTHSFSYAGINRIRFKGTASALLVIPISKEAISDPFQVAPKDSQIT